jgi:cell wall-associated NlpC family hydrolase
MKYSHINITTASRRKIASILIVMTAIVIAYALFTPEVSLANKNHETYTVKPGDTLWQLARSRGYSVESIKKLNRLNSDLLRPNQKLIFPLKPTTTITEKPAPIVPTGKSVKVTASTSTPKTIAKINPTVYSLPLNKTTPTATPRPTPPPTATLTDPRTVPLDPPANIAESRPIRSASGNRSHIQLNTQKEEIILAKEPDFDFDQVFDDDIRISTTPLAQTTPEKKIAKESTDFNVSITRKIAYSTKHTHSTKSRPTLSISQDTPKIAENTPLAKQKTEARSLTLENQKSPSPRLHTRLPGRATDHMRAEVRRIAAQGIRYKGAWRPPGENESWTMDCSNTTRWLYQRVAGVDIGRTASDQYVNLRNRGRAWNVPKDNSGNPVQSFLDKNLRPGDLLFWEHTYRPVRWPPITHVAIYLGKDEQGRHLMAASNSSGTATRRGGPNIYVFRPEMNFGGYRPIGSSRFRHGRFVAFGRPIDNLDRQTFAHENRDLRDLYQ